MLTASAKTGRHVSRLLVEALSLADRARHRIPTPELNRFLGDIVASRQPPPKQGHRLKLLYMAQIETRPPRFSIQVNHRNAGHARLRVLHREPPARALRARGHPADHRLRRAQAAPRGDGRRPTTESLGFFDVRQLLTLGEQTGLTAEDLRPVHVASAVIQREEDDTTAELFLEIP